MTATVHYVEQLYAGFIFDETDSAPIASREPATVTLSDRAYGFCFFDREESTGEHGTMTGLAFNRSGTFYRNGEVFAVEEVESRYPAERILIQNMKSNNLGRVIRTSGGVWREFKDGDVILAAVH